MSTALIVSQVLLWLVVVGLAVVVLALVRQVGLLQARIAPVGALVPQTAPQVGSVAPAFELRDLRGQTVHIGGTRSDQRCTLLVWVAPQCPACKALLPVLDSVRRSEERWLDIVLASEGPIDEHEEMLARLGSRFPYVLSTELGLAYQVPKLPFAVLLDPKGVLRAKGIVNTREHIESLFEAYRHGVGSIQEYLQRQRVAG
ncbi:MAG: methylamine dehydrogenase accessory protein MauD [Candidatus Binatia bacterium]|nr:methylamine dehydrogenase accessory protein MauD [Candidatus Binatia bacterium]